MTDETKNQAAQFLDGWSIERSNNSGAILVRKPGVGGYAAEKNSDNIASYILYALADSLLSAAPAQPVAAQPAATFTRHNKGGSGEFIGVRWNMPFADTLKLPDEGALYFAPPALPESKDAERYRWLRSIGHEQLNVMAHYADVAMDEKIDAAIAASKSNGDAQRPLTLGEQVKQAQAEMATWTPEQRASVQLQGGDGCASKSKGDA